MEARLIETINFKEDYRLHLIDKLKDMGYPVDESLGVRDIAIQYFNVKRRSIKNTARKVHKAKHFTCQTDLQNGLEQFLKKVEAGEDLNPHISKNIRKINYNDGMLNDWGIYHFHLDETIGADGFAERTGDLLYAFVQEHDFYCITISPHGRWEDIALLNDILDNWPTLLEQHRCNEAIGVANNVNQQDIKIFRQVGVNTMIQLSDGGVYAPVGGGCVTSGESLNVVLNVQGILKAIKNVEQDVKKAINDGAIGGGVDCNKVSSVRLGIPGEDDGNGCFFVLIEPDMKKMRESRVLCKRPLGSN